MVEDLIAHDKEGRICNRLISNLNYELHVSTQKKRLTNLLNVKDISFYSDWVCTEDLTFDNIGHLLKSNKSVINRKNKKVEIKGFIALEYSIGCLSDNQELQQMEGYLLDVKLVLQPCLLLSCNLQQFLVQKV